jgi:bifunctional enzyme CysN/CysC
MRSSVETAPAEAEGIKRAGVPLRLVACGACGSGKSALVGRLLDGRQAGPVPGNEGDYRGFASARRAFLVADISDDAQGTRRLAAAAAHADLAMLLADAHEGFDRQAHRAAVLAGLIGVRRLVLAINKMDLAGFERAAFDAMCENFYAFAGALGFRQVVCIPVCARDGDNVSTRSERTPWYAGPPLLEYLETVVIEDDLAAKPFRLPVTSAAADGFSGTLVSGRLRPGDKIAALPAGRTATVKLLRGSGGNVQAAQAGDTITVTLAEQIEAAPGDMLADLRDRPQLADQFAAHLIWLSDHELLPERSYLMRINGCTLVATVTNLKHRIDVDTLAKLAARTLGPDEIGVCNLSVAHPVAFDPFLDNRATGGFVLLDRDSGETVAVGMIDFALRRATNVHYQSITVSKVERAAAMPHRPAVLWFTGLPSAGKSTIANLVEAGLHARGAHTVLLDGDNIRHGLNRDLGFTEADRVENIRRIGEVAKLMTEAGLIVLCSFISPFRAERRMVRELLDDDEFVEIFVDTPLQECIARDPKGLYARALAGEIKNFTGVDQDYEKPEYPEVRLEAGRKDPETLAQLVIEELAKRKIL